MSTSGKENLPSQSVSLWQADYFELKTIKAQTTKNKTKTNKKPHTHTHTNALIFPLTAQRISIGTCFREVAITTIDHYSMN